VCSSILKVGPNGAVSPVLLIKDENKLILKLFVFHAVCLVCLGAELLNCWINTGFVLNRCTMMATVSCDVFSHVKNAL